MNLDVSIIFRITAIGLITAIASQLLKKADKDEIATFVTLAGLIIVLITVVNMVSDLFTSLRRCLDCTDGLF